MNLRPTRLAIVSLFLIFVILISQGYISKSGSIFNPFGKSNQFPDKNEEKTTRIPQVIGIGNKKCSTTALMSFLCPHPQMVCSILKEVHFFDKDTEYQQGTEYYRSQFPPSSSDQLTFEKSPFYFTRKVVPRRIEETYNAAKQDVKFILMLCDPTMRTFSDFNHFLRRRKDDSIFTRNYKSFDDFVEKELVQFKKYLANDGLQKLENGKNDDYDSMITGKWKFFLKGIYYFHLERWLRIFPKSDILVVDGDLLITKPWKVMQEVETFLNISLFITEKNLVINPDTGFHCLTKNQERHCLGSNKGNTRIRSSDGTIVSRMSNNSKITLDRFYKAYNSKLLNLIKKDFTWMH